MKMKKTIFSIATLLCLTLNCYSAGTGSATAEFLNMGVGAKAAALGGAMTAGATGTDSIYWNPAGLVGITGTEASFSHTLWVLDTAHTSAGISMPFGSKTAIGVLVNYLSYGNIDKIDNTGLLEGGYTANDLSAAICFSTMLYDNIPVGLSVKYISSTIDSSAGTAIAADVGLKYFLSKDIIVGAGIFNLGTTLKHSLLDETLPMNIKAGVMYKLSSTTFSADAVLPSAGDFGFSAGGEYTFNLGANSSVSARVGYDSLSSAGGLSAGVGFCIDSIILDYAYIMFGDLGNNHRFSVKMKL